MRRTVSACALLVLAACGDNLAPEADLADAGVVDDISEVPATCTTDRVAGDRADDRALDQVRVLYVLPADAPDEELDRSGRLCASVRAFATWFHDETGALLRLDTAGGAIDLGFVRLPQPDAVLRGDDPANGSLEHGIAFVRERLERELTAAGVLVPGKIYAVYYGGTSAYACGGGAWPPRVRGRLGAFYLRAAPYPGLPACNHGPWGAGDLVPSYVDYAMLHEIVHTLGLVAEAAPHQHTSGHVFDPGEPAPERDLMYTPRPGTDDPPWATASPAGLALDLGSDDYVGPGTPNDLMQSSFLAPLPPGARRPPGW